MRKWLIQEVLPRESDTGQGKAEAKHGCNLRESSLQGNINLIPHDLWNMSDTLEFSPTHCKGLGFMLLDPSVSIQAGAGSFWWWAELPNVSVAAGKSRAIAQGQSSEKESHWCELLGAKNTLRTERDAGEGAGRSLDEAPAVASRQYFQCLGNRKFLSQEII